MASCPSSTSPTGCCGTCPSWTSSGSARTQAGGQVAQAAGVNIQTLRYYERRGLLAEPDRSHGGHRLYGHDAVTALRVIKASQRLGFDPARRTPRVRRLEG
ncbi:MerR family DNA-binding transcriptional regulator [Streptomyces erythrochromogenes]|uniref:MerR family DNA-binding transcriptional regulator n=1 Tax=Streptomyces erythrochromogenes TaxID=285574 RepID=UPI003803B3E9